MKFSILFLFIFHTSLLFSQQTVNYIFYHQSCRKAEKYFIESDYNRCFRTYDSIFNSYDFLFPRDCFIAAQIAYKTGNDSLAVIYLKKGIPFGLNFDLFKADTNKLLISGIRESKFWKNYSKDYDSLRNLYIERVDWKLKKELYDMTLLDQQYRNKNNKWFNRNFRKGLEKEFKLVNTKQINALDAIFKTRGYPGIWLTGVGDSNNIAFNNNVNFSELFFVVLYHYDSSYIRFGNFLFNEIKTGHIHPRVYAMIRDFNDRHLIRKDKNQKMYYNIWWETTNYTEQEFEQHCYEIGCPTKKHLRQLYTALGNKVDLYWSPFR